MSRTKTTKQRTTKPVPLHPQALAVAALAAPADHRVLSPEMEETWAAMPALLRGIHADQDGMPYDVLEAACARAWETNEHLAKVAPLIDDGDFGLINTQTALARIGFDVGLAFACYVLLMPGGAR